MATPSNPIVRAIAGVATMGLSEVPAQFGAAGAAVTGKDPLKQYGKGGSPMDGLMPDMPGMPATEPLASPSMNPATSPAASLRARRNFSTLLTSPAGVTNDSNAMKNTLLGGTASKTGR